MKRCIKRGTPLERSIQAAIIRYFRLLVHDKYRRCLFSIPNELPQIKPNARYLFGYVAKLKEEGMMNGAPDLVLVLPESRVKWIEVKRPVVGRLSEEQKQTHQLFEELGHKPIMMIDPQELPLILSEYCPQYMRVPKMAEVRT